MRAAVIREGSLVVEDRPEPEPGVEPGAAFGLYSGTTKARMRWSAAMTRLNAAMR